MTLSRRTLLALGLSLPAATIARAETPLEIDWIQLIPGDGQAYYNRLNAPGPVDHSAIPERPDKPENYAVTSEFNGRLVRIPGYVVPLDMEAEGVREFLLVPFVGACIHVPPPPPNQLILVTSPTPYMADGMFEPVFVTGRMATTRVSTEIADVGYSLAAELIEPFR